jgi:hypothetical protein
MVIAIPLTGMAKIIFDNVEELRPYGYLLGRHSHSKENVLLKVKHWFSGKTIKKAERE